MVRYASTRYVSNSNREREVERERGGERKSDERERGRNTVSALHEDVDYRGLFLGTPTDVALC